jgi:hypothetical protein
MFGLTLPAWGLKALLLAGVAAVGVVGAEVYEHAAPWGLEAQRDAARKAEQVQADSVADLTTDRNGWKTADGACESARTAERNQAAASVGDAFNQTKTASDAAYNQGYFAGQIAGAKSCPKGGTNATTAPTPGVSDPVDLRVTGADGLPNGPDFADVFVSPPAAPKPVPAGSNGPGPG